MKRDIEDTTPMKYGLSDAVIRLECVKLALAHWPHKTNRMVFNTAKMIELYIMTGDPEVGNG